MSSVVVCVLCTRKRFRVYSRRVVHWKHAYCTLWPDRYHREITARPVDGAEAAAVHVYQSSLVYVGQAL